MSLLFPHVLLNAAVSPGLILPGLLPKMDFLLFLSFPRLEPDEFRVDRPVLIKRKQISQKPQAREPPHFPSSLMFILKSY